MHPIFILYMEALAMLLLWLGYGHINAECFVDDIDILTNSTDDEWFTRFIALSLAKLVDH